MRRKKIPKPRKTLKKLLLLKKMKEVMKSKFSLILAAQMKTRKS